MNAHAHGARCRCTAQEQQFSHCLLETQSVRADRSEFRSVPKSKVVESESPCIFNDPPHRHSPIVIVCWCNIAPVWREYAERTTNQPNEEEKRTFLLLFSCFRHSPKIFLSLLSFSFFFYLVEWNFKLSSYKNMRSEKKKYFPSDEKMVKLNGICAAPRRKWSMESVVNSKSRLIAPQGWFATRECKSFMKISICFFGFFLISARRRHRRPSRIFDGKIFSVFFFLSLVLSSCSSPFA